jgi:hypothetical protein
MSAKQLELAKVVAANKSEASLAAAEIKGEKFVEVMQVVEDSKVKAIEKAYELKGQTALDIVELKHKNAMEIRRFEREADDRNARVTAIMNAYSSTGSSPGAAYRKAVEAVHAAEVALQAQMASAKDALKAQAEEVSD